jgi:hypothetical protein
MLMMSSGVLRDPGCPGLALGCVPDERGLVVSHDATSSNLVMRGFPPAMRPIALATHNERRLLDQIRGMPEQPRVFTRKADTGRAHVTTV